MDLRPWPGFIIILLSYYMKFCDINLAIFKNPDLVAL